MNPFAATGFKSSKIQERGSITLRQSIPRALSLQERGSFSSILHSLHCNKCRGLGDVRQCRNALAEHAPIGRYIARPHLEEIIEAGRHHMALLDLRHALDRAVEFVECC